MFGGKGGVGKTTCATAAALRISLRSLNKSCLLVSTDPAHSLNDSIADYKPPGNLQILELNAQQYLAEFRERNSAPLRDIAAAGTFLDDEDINEFLNLSLPGLDELMAFFEIASWVESRRFDCIVVDTAPSGHTLRFLAMPELVGRWLDMLEVLLAKRRYMRKVFSHDTGPDHLDTFVSDWKDLLLRTGSLLRDPKRSRFVPVTIPESLSLSETQGLLRELVLRRIHFSDLVVNRLHADNGCPFCSSASSAEQIQIQQFLKEIEAPCDVWGIDLLPQEVRGKTLLDFWERTKPISRGERSAVRLDVPREWSVRFPSKPPSSELQLVMFAGKGGVGKTTLSCATAIRMAAESPPKRILLFSTDPAHSLSSCLQLKVGPQPTSILSNLHAMEIDANAEFRQLKLRYTAEVKRFTDSISQGFDLTYDRVVLERMMELAPTGLDEIMAVIRIMRFMDKKSYDVFILDCAPTGHLIRLLELPDVVNQWLKAFFKLFLKYRQHIQLPEFAQELVDTSRNLKKLRQLLRDPAKSVVHAVSIPTQMALEEMKDLWSACDRLGVAVSALFLNMMTPPGDCSFCSQLRQGELRLAGEFARLFPDVRQTLIDRTNPIIGLQPLGELGEHLFLPAREEAISHGAR